MRACPFCGAESIEMDSLRSDTDFYAVCQECCAQGPICATEADAVNEWNGAGQE